MKILKFGTKIIKYSSKALAVGGTPVLPPNTVRVRTNDGNPPTKAYSTSYTTATLVPGTSDVYDVYKSGTDFRNFLTYSKNVVEVLGANTTGIIGMYGMFFGCTSLTTVPLFDTSNVTNMWNMFRNCSSLTSVPLFDTSKATDMSCMFYGCTSLTTVPLFDTSKVTEMDYMCYDCSLLASVPLFDTSSVTRMDYMFGNCINVQSGALALYQQASTQTTPPSNHFRTFRDCGSNTTTGAADLEQIPSNWK